MFKVQFFIHFNAADHAQKLYFAEAFNMAHQLIERFFESEEVGWQMWFNHPEWAVPIVNAQAQYNLPIEAGEVIMGHLGVDSLGDSSCTFKSRFYKFDRQGNEAKVSAFEVTTTHVFINKSDGKKRAIPENIRKCLNSN